MNPTENQLKEFFKEAKRNFLRAEVDNIMSGVSERNLSARLAMYFDRLLDKYSLNNF